MQASTVRGYGSRYRRWVLDSLTYIDVQDLATGGDHIPELGELYVDIALVSRAAYQASGAPLGQAAAGRPMATTGPTRRAGIALCGLQQVSLPQRAVLTLSLSVGRPTAPTTTSAGKT